MVDIKKTVANYVINLGQDFETYKFAWRIDNRNLFLNAEYPILSEIGKMLWDKIKDLNPDIIFGIGTGGMPLLNLIKYTAYTEDSKNLKILFVRDSRKKHGLRKLVEGVTPDKVQGQRAVFIDDLFNTGSTYEKAKKALIEEDFDLNIVGAGVLLDFWEMTGSRRYNAKGFPVRYVYRRHDFGLTRDERFLPTILDKLKWRKHIFHDGPNIMPFKGAPAIYKDYLLVGNDDNTFYCFNKNTGDIIWTDESRNPQPKGICAIPQCHDDRVYWTSYDGTVKCANVHTGDLYWTVKADLNLHSSVCLDIENSRLFLGTEWYKIGASFGYGDIVCLDMNSGFELWRYKTGNMIPATPVYSSKHNYVISGSNDFYVHIVDADTGKLIKKFPTKGEVKGRPALNHDQSIVVASTVQGNVYGIDLNQLELIWDRRGGHHLYHDYPFIEDNFVFIANNTNIAMALNCQTGEFEWLRRIRNQPTWAAVDIGSAILYILKNGQITTLNKKTGEKMSDDNLQTHLDIDGVEIVQPPAFDGQTLYIVTNNKGIIAYDIDISRLQNSN